MDVTTITAYCILTAVVPLNFSFVVVAVTAAQL